MTVQPLAGVRVVEFVHMVMGPSCGLVLADLGADVIKVEPAPDGDNTRRLTGSGAGFFASFNRNKRSIALDLKSEGGMDLARRLIATADVVCENFRPGAMDKLGLGPAALMAAHPRLIYCSLKGFLPGPYDTRVALDEIVQVMGGLSYMTGLPGKPMRAGSSVNDIMGGAFAAIGVLAALIERARTGRGRHVQAGLFENNALLVSQHMSQYAITGQAPKPMGTRDVAWPVYDLFDTADGGQIFLGVVTDTQWRVFCEAFGLDALLSDPELGTQAARRAARARTIPLIAEALRPHTRAALVERFGALGLPYAPVVAPPELFDDPHLNAAGGLVPVQVPGGPATKLPALPISFDGERPGLRHDLPPVGAHGAEIARDLGLSETQIAALRAAGALV
ncbi:CaiB/BaiF CoA transferase family protein [Acidisphaera rubrifaciens]|uniref:L-carnitine dehydratase/bile acid-inducible protein F n=1 Tax=Acidisphaera rubrifaciens HS-AP3 TaxID=1231350 RepID=A0A0D6P4I9_9PROT|nr:CaiB/BaiF CoA-transferase family protein [Acidisphaera rubrifaciens]GAN75804.1 L-carnitine dehydratase/bile acid-inducible protein F [Acidisphaera rubrifaciens HS-AP3]